jgi:signal transduction histidine kinase
LFTTKKHGTGLGLAISKRVALEHHGAIEARSEIAKGSTFTLTLPAVDQ